MRPDDLASEAARYGIERLDELQHFRIEPGVWLAAQESIRADYEADPDVDLVAISPAPPMPAPRMTLCVQGLNGAETTPIFVNRDGETFVIHMTLEGPEKPEPAGVKLRPGRPICDSEVGLDPKTDLTESQQDVVISRSLIRGIVILRVLDLIAEPRLTRRAPDGPRQARRAAQRKHGIPADAWTLVTWELGAPVNAKTAIETGERMPLHYRRGHYKRARPHHEGAHIRQRRTDGRLAWVRWIEGYWAGHPAFGVRRSVHAPRAPVGLTGRPAA